MTTVIIDYGQGNLRSVAAACRHVGMACEVGGTRESIARADALILPGVGSIATAVASLTSRALMIDVLRDRALNGCPVLGICLGMQLLMDWSEEGADETKDIIGVLGLGIIKGRVRKLPDTDGPIPNVGWRSIAPAKSWDGTLLESIAPGSRFYFSHSYACAPENPSDWLATTQWGRYVDSECRDEICCAVQRGNVMGVQFHPEKSGEAGLAVLRGFRRMVENREMAAA